MSKIQCIFLENGLLNFRTSAGGAVVKTFGTGQDEQYNYWTETTLDILLKVQDNL